jgi:hypothetical protein
LDLSPAALKYRPLEKTLPEKENLDDLPQPQPPDPQPAIRLAAFDQHRSLLFSIAYRMLGSVSDINLSSRPERSGVEGSAVSVG